MLHKIPFPFSALPADTLTHKKWRDSRIWTGIYDL